LLTFHAPMLIVPGPVTHIPGGVALAADGRAEIVACTRYGFIM
jgi:hypothetical protein